MPLAAPRLALLENYMNKLGCPTYSNECITAYDDCNDDRVNECDFRVTGLNYAEPSNNIIIFSIPLISMIGQQPPITYLWDYDTNLFTLTGDAIHPTLTVNWIVKPVQSITQFKVTCIDANGCKTTKVCEYHLDYNNGTGLYVSSIDCSNIFTSCSNPTPILSSIAHTSFIVNWNSLDHLTYDVLIYLTGTTTLVQSFYGVKSTLSVSGLPGTTTFDIKLVIHCPNHSTITNTITGTTT